MRSKMQISLSTTFEAGYRVAVEFGKNEWYLGTIKSGNASGWRVYFDDGERHTIDVQNNRMVQVQAPKQRKSSLTLEQVRAMKVASTRGSKKQPAVTKKPVTVKKPVATKPTPPVRKPVATPPAPAPVAKKPNIKETNSQMVEEHHLLTLLGNKSDFDTAARMGRVSQHSYITRAWQRANAKLFGGKLKPCNIYLQKDMGTGFRRRGAWFSSTRKISIAPRLFNGLEAHVLTTLVHEMCHQAVSEIDHVNDRTQGGHGFNWQSWMRECGLTPSRYSKYDNENFMDDDERDEHQKIKQVKEVAKEEAAGKGMKKILWLKDNMPAQFHDAKINKWVKGLVVCRNDQKGQRWIFITEPYGHSWKIVPSDWFYELDEADKSHYLTKEFLDAAAYIVRYKDVKQ